ncbi:hypothetical protein PT974_03798 [Cladobotryum mycophilum]|uniref:P-loop containing nucleoside triphosphate hydrolase protein n=1 Tax=Cladobotryum mycophilum TaxID=491253 RepID=A0ABR0STB9_9HYPO
MSLMPTLEDETNQRGDGPRCVNADRRKMMTSTNEKAEPSEAMNPTTPNPPILCMGMARTGTASLAAALQILGVNRVHHGITSCRDDSLDWEWDVLDRAADATFPVLPTYTGKPFSRAEWDEVFGSYDAVTDVASFYATSLIRAYPEARVILVDRDIDKWFTSITPIFGKMSDPKYQKLIRRMSKLTGSKSGIVCIKMEMGWTEAQKPEEILQNAKTAYQRHYKEVRETVPKEQLLDFKLQDGWGPLCEFLGKEVPDVPFPHENDAAAYAKFEKEMRKKGFKKVLKKIFLPCLS